MNIIVIEWLINNIKCLLIIDFLMRDRVLVTHKAHNLGNMGSNPIPAILRNVAQSGQSAPLGTDRSEVRILPFRFFMTVWPNGQGTRWQP